MASIASQIRIDLITNSASFNSGMQSAGRDGFGSFKDQAEKFDRWFSSRKSVAQRMKEENDAWTRAMQGTGGPLARVGGGSILGQSFGPSGDSGFRNQTRWKSMIPWGNSATSSLSLEEANQAALLGGNGGNGGLRGSRRFVNSLLKREGLGAFGPLLGNMIDDISGATIGIAAFGAGVLAARSVAADLGNEIKQTREEAIKLGMTYDQYVAKKGLPQHSRFVEGAALSATHTWEGIKSVGASVWGGATYLAGGGSGVSALAENARQDESTALWLQKIQANAEKWAKAQNGIEGMQSKLYAFGRTAEDVARNDWIKKFSPTRDQIAEWDALASVIQRTAAKVEASKTGEANMKAWQTAYYGADQMRDREYSDKARAGGMSQEEINANLRLFGNRRQETDSLTRSDRALQSDPSPEEKYQQAIDDAKLRRQKEYEHLRWDANQRYWQLCRKALDDYYKEAEGFDAKQMRRQLQSGEEAFQERIDKLQQWSDDTGRQDLAAKQIAKDSDDRRKQLGVSNPLGDYAKDLEEHRKALASGTITGDEFNAWNTSRRKSVIGEMAGDKPSISLNGAMAAGSAEAHSVIAQASVSDPKTKAAIDTVVALNRIAALIESGKSIDQELLRAMQNAIL